jgi:NADH dehydrogenase [ubiquinone] 1 alpha subcomplex assembly factor 7
MAAAERLAQRVGSHGGAALVVDYGRAGPPYSDSLVAIRAHKGAHPLSQPGTADLSAWVDFGALRVAAEGSGAEVG